ncbi:TKL protein kinase [Phytophthora nicotianae P10297]|uniref:TKL protein kinase n=4 Tax=Phytophthora nicotianae TaxID=4792 RepID=W2QU45_PHYN3|nr:TKL protein kinase [Phytophthora nicotianae INRA-310]ETL78545.1 TKL protein kinase [Phytophthora nicotianae]ETO60228.1 TKL protein kinase [Phytophthora nicotianae P1976]ETP29479.1 TKL protein kinase [Phytophthora nicotianae P10297]KUF77451.1 RasGEF domain-containing serine/threonine-protein kinase X [Phytophthora nicotianae]ETN16024.1 TKL protein kinase [Phytophthora nicotianae INRA-310]
MKEYSLDSLKNDTDDVVSPVKDGFFGSDEQETEAHETPKIPPHDEVPNRAVLPDNSLTKSGTKAESDSGYNSNGADQSGNPDQFNFPTTTPPLPTPWTPTPDLTPTPTATRNASAYESVTKIATPDSSSSMSGGTIAGLVVGIACAMFVIAGFVTMKRRAANQRLSLSKMPSNFGDSQAVPLAKSKLAPPGAFGKLNSRRNHREEPDMSSASGIFTLSQDDPFTRRHMRKGGIWDDPVIVAARIPLEKIRIQELIARGGFGQVFLASYNGQTVAVKTLLPETAQDMTEITALFAETKVMAKLEHPCIVNFIGIAWESLSSISCVTEYLVGGDLRALLNHFLDNHTRPRGFDHDKVKIAMDIAHGLTYLHSMEPNILHRDLKSRNVLLTSQLNAKLTDFGVSRERTDDLMTNAVGTSLWMAPEVMMGGHYDGKADVYSFGVLLSELDTHFMPYANVRNPSGRKPTEAAILQMVAVGNLQVEFSRDCPVELLTLAHACISVEPDDRPTAAEAMHRLQIALKSFEVEEVTL